MNGLVGNSSIEFPTVEESTYEKVAVLFWLGVVFYLFLALIRHICRWIRLVIHRRISHIRRWINIRFINLQNMTKMVRC